MGQVLEVLIQDRIIPYGRGLQSTEVQIMHLGSISIN